MILACDNCFKRNKISHFIYLYGDSFQNKACNEFPRVRTLS
jgi:hypothetical protein